MNSDIAKSSAADFAIKLVKKNMKIGLGTGSTARIFVKKLAKIIKTNSLEIIGVPTSNSTMELAKELGIELANLNEVGKLDFVFDGADEFDPHLNLIKGGGGALLQEKIVAKSAKEMIVLADESKQVNFLGKFPLPVEIVRFGSDKTISLVKEYLADHFGKAPTITLRQTNEIPFISDESHFIIDICLGKIKEPKRINVQLNSIVGVVETGLFTDIASSVVIGKNDGSVEILK